MPFTEEQLQELAAQLRKPEGENGSKIGALMNGGNSAMNRHTLVVVDAQPGEHVLEIGMGNGYFVPNILKPDDSIRYTGADYSELMAQEAAALNAAYVAANRAQFVQADVRQLPFDDHSFDKIFTVNTFYFWDEHAKALAELRRVMQPNGTLVIAVRPKHNLESFPVTKYHFATWDNTAIVELLQNHGFQSIEVTEIKEPPQAFEGEWHDRECVLFACRLEAPASW